MFVLLFWVFLSTSADAETTVLSAPHICPIDPEYACCQECAAREMVCKRKGNDTDLAKAMMCTQSKEECEKSCEIKAERLTKIPLKEPLKQLPTEKK